MKEIEDHSWFPSFLRNYQTEFIGFVVSRFKVYDGFVEYLKTRDMEVQSMSDLCSGSGEPAISIFRKSGCFRQLLLGDKFPKMVKFQADKIKYENKSMDVLKTEFVPGTCYTMFNSFHHFNEEEKLDIVERMQCSGATAFIVEILEPNLSSFLKVLFTALVGSLLLSPFIHPLSLKRLFFTYVLPLNVLSITFDGIVSVFKSRTVQHYENLFKRQRRAPKVFRIKGRLCNLVVIQIQSKE